MKDRLSGTICWDLRYSCRSSMIEVTARLAGGWQFYIMITLSNVSKVLHSTPSGRRNVLNVPSMQINRGESIGISGPNGSGKTTLLRVVAGLDSPTKGTRIVSEKDPVPKVFMLFQNSERSLNPTMDIGAALDEVQYGNGLNEDSRHSFALWALGQVGLDESVLREKPRVLSGGLRQRVCIARALLADPDLLILDEPTHDLDVLSVSSLADLLLMLQRTKRRTLIVASHDTRFVSAVTSRKIIMEAGQIVMDSERGNPPGSGSIQGDTEDHGTLSLLAFCRECASNCCSWGGPLIDYDDKSKLERAGIRVEGDPQTNNLFRVRSKLDGSCVFWVSKKCSVEHLKPKPCLSFPLTKYQDASTNMIHVGVCTRCPANEGLDPTYVTHALAQLESIHEAQIRQWTDLAKYPVKPFD